MLKSKIHRATITEADLNYEGSLTIDKELLDAVDLHPYERVMAYNINNGERFDTYAIEGKPGSGVIGLNGAAARKGMIGDQIIIVSYAFFSAEELSDYSPKIVLLDKSNQIKKWLHK
jgi:aspartate 1-decarboxylase